eukprot:TRINITY_DN7910_c0_g1_i4.p1 TRINITY_DN7910_c0_g1~~TRINITY_DN7910_c0_g1_i4.p1  ORF type:complete len:112 (-),score=22.24 TRINITY_DN7910_c0_g1_i4:151-486(-)
MCIRDRLYTMNHEELFKLSVRSLYRLLLKNMKYYPSKNRHEILIAVKEEFHENKNLKDEKKIATEIKKARIGLNHVLYYRSKMDELNRTNTIKDSGFVESLNPKDKDFIYF